MKRLQLKSAAAISADGMRMRAVWISIIILTPVGKHCTKWSGNLELPDPRPGNMAALLRKASRKRRRWCGCAEAIPFAMRWPFTARGKKSFGSMANHTPQRGRMMAKIFAASSGYRLVENDGLASHGGFKDWFLSEFERPGFTFEIGRGENPLPLSSFERIYEKLEETLLLAALM